MRPGASGKPEVEPYSPDELKFARDAQVIDGPLADYQAKGIAVALEGTDQVEGRKAYRLRVTLPSGAVERIWVDAETFLDVRQDHEARRAGSAPTTVSVFYRNYQTFEGLQIPVVIETRAPTSGTGDRMVIDKVALNQPLDDARFAKPRLTGSHPNGVIVDTRSAGAVAPGRAP